MHTSTNIYYAGGSSAGFRNNEVPASDGDLTFDVVAEGSSAARRYRLTERAIGSRPVTLTGRGAAAHAIANRARDYLATEGAESVTVVTHWVEAAEVGGGVQDGGTVRARLGNVEPAFGASDTGGDYEEGGADDPFARSEATYNRPPATEHPLQRARDAARRSA